jgi:hypothetical protein
MKHPKKAGIPGGNNVVIGSRDRLTRDPSILADRLKARGIHTKLIWMEGPECGPQAPVAEGGPVGFFDGGNRRDWFPGGRGREEIYDGDEEAIRLSREIEHVRNTIDVFRLRFAPKEDPDIRLVTKGGLDSIRIAPLLLVPFVENALKHGLDSAGRGKVEIDIRRDGPRLDIRVENTRRPAGETLRKPPGVGLANVRKRLDSNAESQNFLYPILDE